MNDTLVRIGYSRSHLISSYSVSRDTLDAEVATLAADPDIVCVYYYLHPAAAAEWVKGDAATHRAISDSINQAAR
jgi:hypothetical protein